MQQTTDELIAELSVKRAARRELREARTHLLTERGEGGGFLAPFTDVLKVLRLAAMDISNSLRLIVSSVITFDPIKMQEKIKAFDDRRQKINNEWKPIIDSAREAIGSTDPILKMAILGPANFFALQGFGASLIAGKTVAEVVTATKWDEIINSYTVNLDTDQSINRFFQRWTERGQDDDDYEDRGGRSIGGGRSGGKPRGILGRLARLFTESVSLNEQVPDAKPDKVLTEEEALHMFVQATGMQEAFKKLQTESMQNLRSTIEGIISDIESVTGVSQLFAASDLKQLKSAFDNVKRLNPKFDASSYDKFANTVTTESDKLMKDSKFVEKVKKDFGDTGATPEKIKSVADKMVFDGAKGEFDKSTASGLKKVVDSVGKAIEDLRIDVDILAEMKKSSYANVNDVAKIYEKLLGIYSGIKQDFEIGKSPG